MPAGKNNHAEQSKKNAADAEYYSMIFAKERAERGYSETDREKHRENPQEKNKCHQEYPVSLAKNRGKIRWQKHRNAARSKQSGDPGDKRSDNRRANEEFHGYSPRYSQEAPAFRPERNGSRRPSISFLGRSPAFRLGSNGVHIISALIIYRSTKSR